MSKIDLSEIILQNDIMKNLYHADCYKIFNNQQERFNEITKKFKFEINTVLPNYIQHLLHSIKNWEISKIDVNKNDLKKKYNQMDFEVNCDYYLMRPRKIIKITRKAFPQINK